MTLDLTVLVLLLLLAILGAVSGALRQLLNFVAALVGWLAARAFGPAVAAGLAKHIPGGLAGALAPVLLFVTGFALTGIVGRILLRLGRRSGPVRGPADRGLGALLGAAQGGLGVWVLLSAMVLFGKSIGPFDPRHSDFAALAREQNLLVKLDAPAVESLQRLIQIARDPRAIARLRGDAETRKLLDDPRIQSVLSGSALAGGRDKLSPEALRALSDPELVKRLEQILGKMPEVRP